jgi:hypothetical protein
MPIERSSGGGLSGSSSGNPYNLVGTATPRSALLASQLAAAAAANGNVSVSGVVARGPVAQIVAVHHQPGHPAMYLLHPSSAHSLSTIPFYSSAVSGNGQSPVSLISSAAGIDGAMIQAAALQLQASPSMAAYANPNAANVFLPRWRNISPMPQASAEQQPDQVLRKMKHIIKDNNNNNNKISNSETVKDNYTSKIFNNQNDASFKKLTATSENMETKQAVVLTKKRKSEETLISFASTDSADKKQGALPKSGAKDRKPVSAVMRSPKTSTEQQERAQQKLSSTRGMRNVRSILPPKVICIDVDEDTDNSIMNKTMIERTKELSPSAQQLTNKNDKYPAKKIQPTPTIQVQQEPQQVAQHQWIQSFNGKEQLNSKQPTLEESRKNQDIHFKSTKTKNQEKYLKNLNAGICFQPSGSGDGSVDLAGFNSEEDSDVEDESTDFPGFTIPEPDVDYPLAGPFVQGLVTGNYFFSALTGY